ncbi:hypothetical protein SBA4_3740007 [Candidatus Sulfopaludibacter sp. SbA4]|nr:hypothetical protein SBA4_3740007 [Candidatus Sulfopaludibacter sp. SbA4]
MPPRETWSATAPTNRCEYCLLHQEYSHRAHHIEHIVAKQHGGSDDIGNLALACHRCNLCKGPNLTGLDPESGRIVPLFHPRRDRWALCVAGSADRRSDGHRANHCPGPRDERRPPPRPARRAFGARRAGLT